VRWWVRARPKIRALILKTFEESETDRGIEVRISITGPATAAGMVWGSAILFVEFIHLLLPAHGVAFLASITSFYPSIHSEGEIANLPVGTGLGLLDGAIAGACFAWLHNTILGSSSKDSVLSGRQRQI